MDGPEKSKKRGRFRDMDITTLKESASDPYWDDEASKSIYPFPLPLNDRFLLEGKEIAKGNPADETYVIEPFVLATSPESHIGPFKHARDFLVPQGTLVLAVADGIIIEVQENCDQWGDSPEFRDYLNYLTLQHENGEFSQYCHLLKGVVSQLGLHVGSHVSKGDCIGATSMSGWMDRAHLHFIVFRHDTNPKNSFGFKSLKVSFNTDL
ncbi:MAG: peptidase M23B [Parcubacteria group bacterium Gr01-1014_29]|nr:MAG: peptidase M23B [Parcubacteria group bacterium Gr01-1014_29]